MRSTGRTGTIYARCGLAVAWLAATCSWAATGIDPTNKHAWAENVGWANAGPSNAEVLVYFDGDSGYLTGHAWGENIGWIKMGADAGGPYANNSATNWGVNIDGAGKLSGYAWGENVGWLNFTSAYNQVTIDMETSHLEGYAWGENIGWIKFQGSRPNYSVRALAFQTQPQGTPNWWLDYEGVDEDDDEGDDVPAWKEYVADTDPWDSNSYFYISSFSHGSDMVVEFPSSSRRYYTLEWRGNMMSGGWTNVPSQTDVQGAGGPDSLQEPAGATQRFYRVKVEVTP